MDELNKEQSFGGIEREPSPLDYDLGELTTPTYPEVYLPNLNITIEDQEQIPDCGANAGTYLKEVLHGGDRLSVEYLWDKIKLIDGFPPSSGTDMLSILKTLHNKGICSYQLLPTNSALSVTDFTDPSKITPEMDNDASERKIGAYAFTFSPTMEQLKQAIYTHKGVIMLLRVGKEWWRNQADTYSTWQEKDILPLKPWTPATSGHFVLAYGYDKDYCYFLNEWSNQWGREGIGYFGADYLPRLVEIGTSVDLTTTPYIFVPTIRFGDRGLPVKMLQTKLGITSDGVFGRITAGAVALFQHQHNLVADSIVGIKTCEALNL